MTDSEDIVVALRPKVLDTLKRGMCGQKWSWIGVHQPPVKTDNGNLLFVSIDGMVVGYFEIQDTNRKSRKMTYVFNKDSWIELAKPIKNDIKVGNHRYRWWK